MSAHTHPELVPWRDMEIIKQRAEQHYRNLPFHSFTHALDVFYEIETIADDHVKRGTPLEPDVIEDAQIGGLYHDAGYFVPLHVHHFKSKEAYSADLMRVDQTELGMPARRIQRIGAAILSTQMDVKPKTKTAKLLRQADLSNVAKMNPIEIVRNTVRLFREDEILKRDYDHPGEIKTDILSFVINSYSVMRRFNQYDVSLAEYDHDHSNTPSFTQRLEQGMECFKPERAEALLRRLKLLPPQSTDPKDPTAS